MLCSEKDKFIASSSAPRMSAHRLKASRVHFGAQSCGPKGIPQAQSCVSLVEPSTVIAARLVRWVAVLLGRRRPFLFLCGSRGAAADGDGSFAGPRIPGDYARGDSSQGATPVARA